MRRDFRAQEEHGSQIIPAVPEPALCAVTAVNAKTGVVSVKDTKTGRVTQYKAEPVNIQGLKVGDAVDLVGGVLRTATGATITGRVQP
jgi:hypothetical protein